MSIFDNDRDRFPPRVRDEPRRHPVTAAMTPGQRERYEAAGWGTRTYTENPMRIAIIGWPGTGKTTLGKQLAEDLGLQYSSTDEAMHLGWSQASEEVAKWLDRRSYIIEGVALPRAFRKWRANHPGEAAPVDRLVHLSTVYRDPLKPGEISMGKGIDTVLKELEGWLPAAVDHAFFEAKS